MERPHPHVATSPWTQVRGLSVPIDVEALHAPAPSLLVCKLLTPSLVASHYYTEEPFAGPYPCKNYASKDSPLLSPGQTEGCRSR